MSGIGLALRVEHALTFDGLERGADYEANLEGVRWMLAHWQPFDFNYDVGVQVGYQPPLWYALAALILRFTGSERAIAVLAVGGWVLRQALLARALKGQRAAACFALTVNAFLPISVLTDGKVNPEAFHSAVFTAALFMLWKLERESRTMRGMSPWTAASFGALSGIAVLTKATSGVLPLIAAAVLLPRILQPGVVRAALCAGFMWCAVAGFWIGPNLVHYGHPFPHAYHLREQPREPVLYRRPLGWALPFEWAPYFAQPVIVDPSTPIPNFWAVAVTGTFSDFYNRGFCRLTGGGYSDRAWGARWTPPHGGREWYVSRHCFRLFRALLATGCVLTVLALAAAGVVLRTRRSLALPLGSALVVLFVLMFALMFPYDNEAVLNPRYLLPIATPLAACLGVAYRDVRTPPWLRGIGWLAVAAMSGLVLLERV